MSDKAVCLLSGGLDSTITAYHAKKQGYDILTLTINYGQHHEKELLYAQKISTSLKALKHVILPVSFNHITSSSLLQQTDHKIPYHTLKSIPFSIPTTYVPGRNIIFLSLGISWAESEQANAIFTGVNAIDYSGYPDCRPEFIEAFQKMIEVGTKAGVQGNTIKILTPLLHKTKSEIINYGNQLNVPFEHTWSCYRGEEKACGRCDACILRLKGFQTAGIPDPLPYQHYPSWYNQN